MASMAAGGARAGTWRGLLWCEWFAHSKLLLLFLAGWLTVVWALPLFAHPGYILLYGLAYALVAGPLYGGGDVVAGCEEFTFALPASRGQRYLARLVVGGGSLLLFTAMDLLALGLDLSQALARLYVQTGLIQPLQVARPGLLYALVLALPLAVFGCSFAWAASTHSRGQVFTAWLWGGVVTLGVLYLGLHYEEWHWGRVNGRVACPALVVLGLASVALAGAYYRRKEIGPPVAPIHLPGRWWVWLLFVLAAGGLILALGAWFFRQAPRFLGGP